MVCRHWLHSDIDHNKFMHIISSSSCYYFILLYAEIDWNKQLPVKELLIHHQWYINQYYCIPHLHGSMCRSLHTPTPTTTTTAVVSYCFVDRNRKTNTLSFIEMYVPRVNVPVTYQYCVLHLYMCNLCVKVMLTKSARTKISQSSSSWCCSIQLSGW